MERDQDQTEIGGFNHNESVHNNRDTMQLDEKPSLTQEDFQKDYQSIIDSTPDFEFKAQVKKFLVENLATLPLTDNELQLRDDHQRKGFLFERSEEDDSFGLEMRRGHVRSNPDQPKLSLADSPGDTVNSTHTGLTAQLRRAPVLRNLKNAQKNPRRWSRQSKKSSFYPRNRSSLGAEGLHQSAEKLNILKGEKSLLGRAQHQERI